RPLEVLGDVHRQRLERGHVHDARGVGYVLARLVGPVQRIDRHQEAGERLARARWRRDQRVAAACDERPALGLWLGRPIGKAAREPFAHRRVEPGQGWMPRPRKAHHLDHLVIVPIEQTFAVVSGFVASALPQNFVDPAGQVCLKTNPTGGNDDERVQQASRHDLARALAPRYAHASRRQKGQILDEFCAITGYTRKHALVMLSRPPVEDRARSVGGRPRSYGPAEVALLRVCWSATDGICSKRLAPFLPELLARLRHWHALRHVSAGTIERVARMSPSTID